MELFWILFWITFGGGGLVMSALWLVGWYHSPRRVQARQDKVAHRNNRVNVAHA